MPALLAIALVIGLAYLYFLGVAWFFQHLAWPILVAGSSGISIAVLAIYVGSVLEVFFGGQAPADEPSGKEPAFKQYYFRKAYIDYRAIVERAWEYCMVATKKVVGLGAKLFVLPDDAAFLVVFTWPLGLLVYAISAVGAMTAVVVFAAFGLIHLTIVALASGVALSGAALFRMLEVSSMLWRRIFLVCPNAGCYKKVPIPTFICPDCAAEHQRLVPGSYGVFKRRCRCGNLLPTLFLFGRDKLPSLCPHCKLPLIFVLARNLHLPVVGGPSAGKTSFLMASMADLYRRSETDQLRLSFPDERQQALFESCHAAFGTGSSLAKTAKLSPDAFRAELVDGSDQRAVIFTYDAAGELYQQADVLRAQEYFTYTHGILFLIDPFSLAEIQGDYASRLAEDGDRVRPSDERPQEVYDRLIATLRELSRLGRGLGRQPFAVVITKADAFGLSRELCGTEPEEGPETIGQGPAEPGQAPSSGKDPRSDIDSAAVRDWLARHGESNLIRCIEGDFRKVRYFSCSALGRLPDDSAAPFVPSGVLTPLSWILAHHGIQLDAGFASQARKATFRLNAMRLAASGAAIAVFAVVLGGLAIGAAATGRAVAAPMLVQSASAGSAWQVRTLLALGADPNFRNGSGDPVLHLAAGSGDVSTLDELLRAGARVDVRSRAGETPLMAAAARNRGAMVRHLIKKGAALNARDPNGRSALMAAARAGGTETIKALLDWGANRHFTDYIGYTAIQTARSYRNAAAADLLLNYGRKKSGVRRAAKRTKTRTAQRRSGRKKARRD